jgi:hypothetical protein
MGTRVPSIDFTEGTVPRVLWPSPAAPRGNRPSGLPAAVGNFHFQGLSQLRTSDPQVWYLDTCTLEPWSLSALPTPYAVHSARSQQLSCNTTQLRVGAFDALVPSLPLHLHPCRALAGD